MLRQLQVLVLVDVLHVTMFLQQFRVVVQQVRLPLSQQQLQLQARHSVLLHRRQLLVLATKLSRCQRFVRQQAHTWWQARQLVLTFSALSKLTMQMLTSLDFVSKKSSKHKKASALPTCRSLRVQLLMHWQTSHT